MFSETGSGENLKNCVEIGLEVESFLEDCNKHIDRDGDPDLGLDGILGDAKKDLMRRCCLIHLKKSSTCHR